MVRKKKDPSSDEAVPLGEAAAPTDDSNPEAELPPEMQEVQKTWTKRPDPFGFETIRWADGYAVSLRESDGNREVFIQFGSGSKADQPQNFEAIKKMFKDDYRMHWDPKIAGWAKGLKPGVTPLIKEENRRTRSAVEEAFYKAVALEEERRGPSLTEHARERSAPIR